VKPTSTAIVPAVATRRRIGRFRGTTPGPALVCIGSLHGNEPAGAEALQRVCTALSSLETPLARGDFLALAGNLAALRRRLRFVDADLNRHWTERRLASVERGDLDPGCAEDAEMFGLLEELTLFWSQASGPVFLLDLHTTSAEGPPFATVGARRANRTFALGFGVPVALGLQEGLRGTLLDFIEKRGHVGMGFEGGQHVDPASVDAIESLVLLALSRLGLLGECATPFVESGRQRLERITPSLPRLFDVRYRYAVDERSRFRMQPGWAGFQTVTAGELVAHDGNHEVRTSRSGRLLMPLYQQQGEDGFFLMQIHSPLRHAFGRLLSRLPVERLLVRLPGIEFAGAGGLLVDRRWIEGPGETLLLLLGYRSRRFEGERTLLVHSRRR
jgi:succinylglutamate desuccinylase